MRAIILAAGRGTRLGAFTEDRPKCMVELAGHPLLYYQLRALNANGLTNVGVVTGHKAHMLEDWPVTRFHNPAYETTNMVFSLFTARNWLAADDLLMCYGDIVYEPNVISAALAAAPAPVTVVVDTAWRRYWAARMDDPLADAETLKLDPHARILEIGRRPKGYEEIDAQYIGMVRFSRSTSKELCRAWDAFQVTFGEAGSKTLSMTEFLQWLITSGWHLQSARINGGWLELDTARDHELYQRLIESGELDQYCQLPQ